MFLRRLTLPDGVEVCAEVTQSLEERRAGLMHRIEPAWLLFLFPAKGKHPVWMANVRFPIDAVWMDEQSRIVELARGLRPFSMRAVGGKVRSSMLLEMPSGSIDEHGLQVGQTIQ